MTTPPPGLHMTEDILAKSVTFTGLMLDSHHVSLLLALTQETITLLINHSERFIYLRSFSLEARGLL